MNLQKISDPKLLAQIIFERSRLQMGDIVEKREKIYPITEHLEHLFTLGENLEQVIEHLHTLNGVGEECYRVVSMPIEGQPRQVLMLVPPDVFDPTDPWGRIFRRGLAQIELYGKTLFNPGGGSGADIIQMIQSGHTPRRIVYNDIDPHVARVAQLNIERICGHCIRRNSIDLEFRVGDAADILSLVELAGKFDYILGCLPQVPADGDNLLIGQRLAHQYDDNRHHDLHKWGLGLLADIKKAGRRALKANGRFVLVHSGRDPMAARAAMDELAGCREESILHEEMVLHHAGTPLQYLFSHLDQAQLFSDPAGRQRLNPQEAELLREKYASKKIAKEAYNIFHKVLVVSSQPHHNGSS